VTAALTWTAIGNAVHLLIDLWIFPVERCCPLHYNTLRYSLVSTRCAVVVTNSLGVSLPDRHVLNETSCLHYLLPPKRDDNITAKRRTTLFENSRNKYEHVFELVYPIRNFQCYFMLGFNMSFILNVAFSYSLYFLVYIVRHNPVNLAARSINTFVCIHCRVTVVTKCTLKKDSESELR